MHDICSLYGHSGETTMYVLISCPIARDCWKRILTSIELSMELHSISNLVLLVKSLKGRRVGEVCWKQTEVMYAG